MYQVEPAEQPPNFNSQQNLDFNSIPDFALWFSLNSPFSTESIVFLPQQNLDFNSIPDFASQVVQFEFSFHNRIWMILTADTDGLIMTARKLKKALDIYYTENFT